MPKRSLLDAKVAFCLFERGKGSCWVQAVAHVAFSAQDVNSGEAPKLERAGTTVAGVAGPVKRCIDLIWALACAGRPWASC